MLCIDEFLPGWTLVNQVWSRSKDRNRYAHRNIDRQELPSHCWPCSAELIAEVPEMTRSQTNIGLLTGCSSRHVRRGCTKRGRLLLHNQAKKKWRHEMDTAQASMRLLAAVENPTSSSAGIAETRGASTTGCQHGRKRSRPLVPGQLQSPASRSFQCAPSVARAFFIVRKLPA